MALFLANSEGKYCGPIFVISREGDQTRLMANIECRVGSTAGLDRCSRASVIMSQVDCPLLQIFFLY